ncbi:MAG: YdeI/OmpD-associated family protein [Solirubrobacterales bacterium]
MSDERPHVHIESVAELRAWLDDNHGTSDGVWIVAWKKDRGPYVSWGEIVPELLAYGWIDSKAGSFDEDRRKLTITPRNPKSAWSRRNKEIIATLEAERRMAPAGAAMVALAKETGTWTELDEVEALIEPAELATALDADPAARANWDAFPRSAKRFALLHLHTAKREETRAKRVAEIATKAARNERVG